MSILSIRNLREFTPCQNLVHPPLHRDLGECRWPLHLLVVPYSNRDIPQESNKLLVFVEKSVIHRLQHFGVKKL
jgi:hypothetical protein